jgi:hypothetical protein
MDKRIMGITEAVLACLTANSDRPIGIAELMSAAPKGAGRSSVNGAVRRLMGQFPRQLEQRGRGIYVWHSAEQERSAVPDLIILRVLSSRDSGELLGGDEDGGRAYVLRPLNDW